MKNKNYLQYALYWLLKNNLNGAYKNLKKYLKTINKEEYFFLVKDLIELSVLNNEIGFTTPLLTIQSIKNNKFTFNFKEYLESYKISLLNGNQEETEIYKDIINNYYKIESKNEENQTNLIETARNYILSIENTIKERGIVILEPIDLKGKQIINAATSSLPNIKSFTIYDGTHYRIVLQYKTNNYLNIKWCINEATLYYNQGNFKEAEKEYRKLLEFGKLKISLKILAFTKLGLCYMKMGKFDLAIDYLTVSNYLHFKEKSKVDFGSTIEKLKRKVEEPDAKSYVTMTEKDFDNPLDENMFKIMELIEYGMSLEEISNILTLNEEDKLITLILAARICYTEENYKQGDIYLSDVLKSKNKTRKVLKLLEQTRKDKKFFKNRKDNTLTLTK